MALGIVSRCLAELSCSLFIDSIFHKFANSKKASLIIFGSVITQTISNTFIRWNAEKISIANLLCSNVFAFLTGTHAQRLLHEAGHAWTSTLVFKNAQPKITLFPFGEETTKYKTDELTDLGKKLGKTRSLCLVTIAGPAASLMISTSALLVGAAVHSKFPEIGSYLIAYGRMDFFAHGVYALSALNSSSPRHDFVILKTRKIHPLAVAVALFAIPVFILKKHTQAT